MAKENFTGDQLDQAEELEKVKEADREEGGEGGTDRPVGKRTGEDITGINPSKGGTMESEA